MDGPEVGVPGVLRRPPPRRGRRVASASTARTAARPGARRARGHRRGRASSWCARPTRSSRSARCWPCPASPTRWRPAGPRSWRSRPSSPARRCKGPADRLLAELGHESSVVGVARLYAAFVGTLVVDDADAALGRRRRGLRGPLRRGPDRHAQPRSRRHAGVAPARRGPTLGRHPGRVPRRPSADDAGALTVVPVTGLGEVRPGDDLATLIAGARRGLRRRRRGRGHPEDRVQGRGPHGADRPRRPRRPSSRSSSRSRCASCAAAATSSITETRHGFVCANAGVDLSNVEDGTAALLPEDSDRSARRIRDGLRAAHRRRGGGHRVRHLRPDLAQGRHRRGHRVRRRGRGRRPAGHRRRHRPRAGGHRGVRGRRGGRRRPSSSWARRARCPWPSCGASTPAWLRRASVADGDRAATRRGPLPLSSGSARAAARASGAGSAPRARAARTPSTPASSSVHGRQPRWIAGPFGVEARCAGARRAGPARAPARSVDAGALAHDAGQLVDRRLVARCRCCSTRPPPRVAARTKASTTSST